MECPLADGVLAIDVGAVHVAASLTGRHYAMLKVLAAAYAEAGRFNEAAQSGAAALDDARAKGDQAAAAEIEKQLSCYRARQPWREGTRSEAESK